MSLTLSPQRMTFGHSETVKYVRLTNHTSKNGQPQPIMFKIKTNKIELVDAKPSCGYISALPGKNEINVAIRWLNNTNDHSAKLQILFAHHPKITQEIVQKNSAHFDNDEYNQNYDLIKKQSQSEVKTILLPVTRKPKEQPQPQPQPQPQQLPDPPQPEPKPKSDPSPVNTEPVKINQSKKGISTAKCILFVLTAFLIGFLAGFSLAKAEPNELTKSLEQIYQRTVSRTIENSVINEVKTEEKVEEGVPVTNEGENSELEVTDNLGEFVEDLNLPEVESQTEQEVTSFEGSSSEQSQPGQGAQEIL